MTLQEAKKKAKKVFGKNAYVSWNPSALDEEAKKLLRVDQADARKSLAECEKTDKVALTERKRRVSEISGKLLQHRAQVGFVAGVAGIQFFHVKGEGDTFEQAFESAKVRASV